MACPGLPPYIRHVVFGRHGEEAEVESFLDGEELARILAEAAGRG